MKKSKWSILILLLGLTFSGLGQDCNPGSDLLVLRDFQEATDGRNWKVKWDLNKSLNQWYGVKTNATGCVIELNLSDNGLKGVMPKLRLPHLTKLDLSHNELSNEVADLSEIKKLRELDISNNRFRKGLSEVLKLEDLEVLRAENNQLSEPLPGIGSLTRLRILDLSGNQLTGDLPDLSELARMEEMDLSSNKLKGGVTFLSQYPNLTRIDLHNNQLSGPIPDLLESGGLIHIDLSKNLFSGNLPQIDGLTRLKYVNFSDNQITGSFTWPEQVPELQELYLSHNLLQDTLPDTGPVGRLESFYISNNRLSGHFPKINLPQLKELLLDQNQLTGRIPDLKSLPVLEQFSFRLNYFDGVDFDPDRIRGRIFFGDLSENKLSFVDLVPFVSFSGHTLILMPQKPVTFKFDSFIVTKGNNFVIELNTHEDHFSTEFRWYKDGVHIRNSREPHFILSNIIPRDAGDYSVVMTHPQFSGNPIYSGTFHLEVTCPEVVVERKIYLCPEEIFTFKGIAYASDTIVEIEVPSMDDRTCDSLYVFNIERYHADSVHVDTVLCTENVYYFGPDSIELTRSGIYLDTFPNIGGCDSIVLLNLIMRSNIEKWVDYGLCPGDSLIWKDRVYYQNVDLTDTLTSLYGCDSIVILQVRFSDPVITETVFQICEGDSVLIEDRYFSSAVEWRDTSQARGGCDSISIIRVVENEKYEETNRIQLCGSVTYEWQGMILSESGLYSDTLRTINGCDSILHLDLVISPVYDFLDTVLICLGDSVYFDNYYIFEPGHYISQKSTAMGCDSLNRLVVEFREFIDSLEEIRICAGDTLLFGDMILYETGIYRDTLFSTSEIGCDTVITLHLAVISMEVKESEIAGSKEQDPTGRIIIGVSGGVLPYIIDWNTGDSTMILDSIPSGIYTVKVIDSIGCIAEMEFEIPILTAIFPQPEMKKWVRIRPNFIDSDANGNVILEFQDQMGFGEINLYNQMGQEVWHRSVQRILNGQTIQLNLRNLPPGIYSLRILEKESSAFQVEKLIVF